MIISPTRYTSSKPRLFKWFGMWICSSPERLTGRGWTPKAAYEEHMKRNNHPVGVPS